FDDAGRKRLGLLLLASAIDLLQRRTDRDRPVAGLRDALGARREGAAPGSRAILVSGGAASPRRRLMAAEMASPSVRTRVVRRSVGAGSERACPVRMTRRGWCRGHSVQPSSSQPSESSAWAWVQTSAVAKYSPPLR